MALLPCRFSRQDKKPSIKNQTTNYRETVFGVPLGGARGMVDTTLSIIDGTLFFLNYFIFDMGDVFFFKRQTKKPREKCSVDSRRTF